MVPCGRVHLPELCVLLETKRREVIRTPRLISTTVNPHRLRSVGTCRSQKSQFGQDQSYRFVLRSGRSPILTYGVDGAIVTKNPTRQFLVFDARSVPAIVGKISKLNRPAPTCRLEGHPTGLDSSGEHDRPEWSGPADQVNLPKDATPWHLAAFGLSSVRRHQETTSSSSRWRIRSDGPAIGGGAFSGNKSRVGHPLRTSTHVGC
jgi:hypothetical protein